MHPKDLVTLDRFRFSSDAEIARATLEAAGIDAVLADENIARMAEGQSHGGVRLQVRREDAEEAREILDSVEFSPEPLVATGSFEEVAVERCRRCTSEEIYPAESRSRSFGRIVVFTWLAFVVINAGRWGIAIAKLESPARLFDAAYAITLIAAFGAVLFVTVAPRRRCRSCGLEWRGKSNPTP